MVITRFAPSPTGYLHIGGLRTALFNYLWARKNGGHFRLRIEDTDLTRNSEEAMKAILEAFSWVGMGYDDEVVYQSQRFDLYKNYIQQLLDEGKAYHCWMSKEALDELREAQMQRGEKPKYDNRYRDWSGTPPEGIDPVIRIKAPLEGEIVFEDGVKGEVRIEAKELDDFIIARSDGSPTYNFVVAIDDALMGVTDVIRGDDHLSNTPKQLIVYQALDLRVPKFFHVPMILNPKGQKLSKRDGAMDVMEYQKMGFLPDALLNFLVRLGWSHGDQEIFTMEEMQTLFDPKDINRSASAYNAEKLEWLNAHHIKNRSNDQLAEELEPYGLLLSSHDKKAILLDALKDRAKNLVELAAMARPILYAPESYDEKSVQKHIKEGSLELLEEFVGRVESSGELHLPVDFETIGHQLLEEKQLKMPKLGQPIRIALIGSTTGPGVYDIMAVIGKEETVVRIRKAIDALRPA